MKDSTVLEFVDSALTLLKDTKGLLIDLRYLRDAQFEPILNVASRFFDQRAKVIGVRRRVAGIPEYHDTFYFVTPVKSVSYTRPVLILAHQTWRWPQRAFVEIMKTRQSTRVTPGHEMESKGMRGIEPKRIQLADGAVLTVPTAVALTSDREPLFDAYSNLHEMAIDLFAIRFPMLHHEEEVSEALYDLLSIPRK
jgi:hypothetical protein